MRWRGDTRCGCTSALLPGTVNSLWQLLLPYHTGRVVMGGCRLELPSCGTAQGPQCHTVLQPPTGATLLPHPHS